MNRMELNKISLTNYDPSTTKISESEMDERTVELKNEVVKLCKTHNVSYVQINKALYSADRELYFNAINQAIGDEPPPKRRVEGITLDLGEATHDNRPADEG